MTLFTATSFPGIVLEENTKAKNLYLKLKFKTFLSGYDPMTNKKLLILYKNI